MPPPFFGWGGSSTKWRQCRLISRIEQCGNNACAVASYYLKGEKKRICKRNVRNVEIDSQRVEKNSSTEIFPRITLKWRRVWGASSESADTSFNFPPLPLLIFFFEENAARFPFCHNIWIARSRVALTSSVMAPVACNSWSSTVICWQGLK